MCKTRSGSILTHSFIFGLFVLFSCPVNLAKSEEVKLKGEVRSVSYEKFLSKQTVLVLDLKTVLLKALDNSLDIDLQNYSIKKAEDNFIKSTTEFLPSISLVDSLSRRDGSIQLFGDETMKIRQKSATPKAVGSFGLFQGGRVLFGWMSSDKLLKAEKTKIDSVKQALLSKVAQTYFQLRGIESEMESELQRLEQAEQNKKERQISLDVGDDIKLSVLLATQEVEEAKARITALRGQFYSTSARLNELLNMSFDTLIVPVKIPLEKELIAWAGQNPSLERLVYKAVENSPSLKAEKYLIESLQARQYQTVSAFLPTVSLQGELGYIGATHSELEENNQGIIQVKYDVLENLGGSAVSNFLLAKHTREQEEIAYKKNLRVLERQVSETCLDVLSKRDTFLANKSALEAAQETYRNAKIRLVEGVGTQYELTVAQSGLERVRSSFYNSLVEYRTAEVRLIEAVSMINVNNLTEGITL